MPKVKAAVMSQFENIETQTFPYPEVTEDTMVGKVIMTGICGTDLHYFSGKEPNLPLPIILGHESLLEIVEIGNRAQTELEATKKSLAPGDRVVFHPDLPVENVGTVATWLTKGLELYASTEMLRRGGTYLETGSFANTGETTINPFKHLCHKDVYLLGHYGSPPESYLTALRFIEMAWRDRHLALDKIVTHKFPLNKTQQALVHQQQQKGMKAVIQP